MFKTRIKSALAKAGLVEVPNDNEALENYGLNSLILALLIIELEKEFKIKIPVLPIAKERFVSVSSIEEFVKELGAL